MDSPKEKKSPGEVFERLWSQALLAVNTAEEEATRTLQRAAEVAGWSQEEVRRQVRDFTERLAGQRREMERNVEEGVKGALSRVRLPRREDLLEAHARVEKLAERIAALEQER
jgi:polyhydroxyalkanoate synthesis regulator phasin